MSDRRDQGVPSPTAQQPEDAWWDAVYGPGGSETTPAPRTGTIDDWFASALGAIGEPAQDTAPEDTAPEDTAPEDAAPLSAPPPRFAADPRVISPRSAYRPSAVAEPAAQAPPPAAAPPAPTESAPPVAPDAPDTPGTPAVEPEAAGPADAPAVPAPESESESESAPEPASEPLTDAEGEPDLQSPTLVKEPLAPPPHVPTPTLPDGASARWGRSRPQTGAPLPEPDALPEADPEALSSLVPDTALDLARHGSMTLRAASARGEQARALGLPRSDRLLVARFGEGGDGLLVVVIAAGPAGTDRESAAHMLAAAVGRSRTGLLADLREGAQERLRYGLQRLTARATRELGAGGALHALIAPLDPTNRLRAGFGTGPGALLLLGDDAWYDAYAGRRLASEPEPEPKPEPEPEPDPEQTQQQPQPDRFRFRAVVPEPGDVLLLCSEGLAAPLRGQPAVAALLAEHWSLPHAPSGVDFLRQVQARAQGHSADRTAAAIWEE